MGFAPLQVCESAGKEYAIEAALDKMQNEWKQTLFEIVEYRETGAVQKWILLEQIAGQLLYINVRRFRGWLVFKAQRRLHRSTLGLVVIKKNAWTQAFFEIVEYRETRQVRDREGLGILPLEG